MAEEEWIEGDWKFGSSGGDETYLKVHLKFRSVVPDLSVPEPTDVSYDFSAALAEFLGLSQDAWRIEGLGISKSVPQRVLHEFYDRALLYGARLAGTLPDAFGALCTERLLVKCLSGFPEVPSQSLGARCSFISRRGPFAGRHSAPAASRPRG